MVSLFIGKSNVGHDTFAVGHDICVPRHTSTTPADIQVCRGDMSWGSFPHVHHDIYPQIYVVKHVCRDERVVVVCRGEHVYGMSWQYVVTNIYTVYVVGNVRYVVMIM
jgi:hypothetical protein